VVVDPRRTKTAEHADEHVAVRPGTDAFFLLALASVLFEEDLVDVGRLAPHVVGVEEARGLVEPFAPEAVAARTGVDAPRVRRLARELAAAPAAAVHGRVGNHTVEFGTLASWAADLCNVLTGNLDRPGGVMFASPAHQRLPSGPPGGRGFRTGRWHSRVRRLPEVRSELPVSTLADEIETPGDGQVRALLLVAGNPVRSLPNSERLDAAFASLECMIAIDPYLNESSRHADVVLPPPSPLERPHYDFAFSANAVRTVAKWSSAVFPARGPSEDEIFARLMLILSGQGSAADPTLAHDMVLAYHLDRELARFDSPIHGRDRAEILAALAPLPEIERVVDLRLRTGRFGDGFGADPDGLTLERLRAEPHGIDFGPLVERFPDGIKTTSGRVELAPEPIVDDMARLRAALEQPEGNGLRLVGRRHVRSNNSWMHNVDVLVKGRDRCTLQVHPDDAARIGLDPGGDAVVTSRVGAVETPVEVTDAVMPGVVSLPHGWGHGVPGTRMHVAADHAGVNLNALTDDTVLDPLSGNSVLNGTPVTVVPAPVDEA